MTAFVEFIAQFDMPSSPNSKKKDAALETGRPFRPVMFEGVLKNFTPDVANSISGRPRFVRDRYYLFFLLDSLLPFFSIALPDLLLCYANYVAEYTSNQDCGISNKHLK